MQNVIVKVPEAGLKAVLDEWGQRDLGPYGVHAAECLLEAFIRWQDGKLESMTFTRGREYAQAIADVRRMYLAPEPEASAGFTDLWWDSIPTDPSIDAATLHNRQIRIAWNRAKTLYSASAEPEPSSSSGIADLLWQHKKSYHHQPHELNARHDEAVEEAFRRGQRSQANAQEELGNHPLAP
jgi:hypothetical protein